MIFAPLQGGVQNTLAFPIQHRLAINETKFQGSYSQRVNLVNSVKIKRSLERENIKITSAKVGYLYYWQ